MPKDQPEAGECAPFRSGLFRPLRSPAYEGSWSAQGCLLQRVREEEAVGQERKMLDVRRVLLKKRRGSRSMGVSCFQREEGAGEKGTATTQACNVAAVVYFSQTAVILARRSSSHPRGVGLESPNLSAALPNVVAYGGSRLHIAPVVMTVYMPCSS